MFHTLTEEAATNRLYIDLALIKENINRIREHVGRTKDGNPVKVVGVIKAVGYGTHLTSLGKRVETLGLDMLGVSSPDEGAQLRKSGVTLPMLCLLCPPNEAEKAVRHNLIIALYSKDLADALAGTGASVHLKINTGMGRLGVKPEEAVDLARCAREKGLTVSGVMTHLSVADDPSMDKDTRKQFERFDATIALLKSAGFDNLISHASATSGTLRYKELHNNPSYYPYDMVRIGIGLYGITPSPAVQMACPLVFALSLRSRIVSIRQCLSGERLGYGGTFSVPEGGLRVGIIPFGYHDGIPWRKQPLAFGVMILGKWAKVVGRVSMDSVIVDLSGIPECVVGDEVVLWGLERSIDDFAEEVGSMSYELLTRLGPRVQRVFLGE